MEQEKLSEYFETSALMGDYVKPTFDHVIGIVFKNLQSKKDEMGKDERGNKKGGKGGKKDKGC